MAATKAGLFSLDASGSLAGSIVFSRWKGRQYVRQLVTPANPKSGLQTGMRSVMRFLTQQYASLSAGNKALWATDALVDNITALNADVRFNQRRARQNLGVMTNSSEAAGTTPGAPTSPVATAAPKSVILTWVNSVTGTLNATFIFRSLTGTFTRDISNLVRVVPTSLLTYTDPGLTTGIAQFYEIAHCNIGGILGTSTAEITATPL